MSRSPVSEAVARLASEGLVSILPQAGTYVARFSMDEIRESAFLREALVEDGGDTGFYEKNDDMHLLLLSFTGCWRVARMGDIVWFQVSRARRLILPEPGWVAETLRKHREITYTLAAHDTAAVRQPTR